MLRFAPSPTGFLHAGNLRVAILNYIFAKQNNIEFFLRIDDTDRERSKDEFINSIQEDLEWVGVKYKKIVKQSSRLKQYNDIFNFLKKKKLIYPCFESSEELSLKRKVQLKMGKPPIYDRSSLKLSAKEISDYISKGQTPHWRLKLDDESISWNDLIHGKISFSNLSVSDPVVFRSDEMPLFTITSVVDDAEFKVSHILRGDDHITNTAAQIKLFMYLDSPVPKFGHFPLMQSQEGSSLSKRDNSLSIRDFREKKICPMVVLNYLNKIGTKQSIEQIDTIENLFLDFDFSNFSKSSVIFNYEDLERLNSKFIKNLNFNSLKKIFKPKFNENFWNIIRDNIDHLDEADNWYEIVYGKKIFKKINLEKKLYEKLIVSLPNKIDEKSWSIWTKEVLNSFDLKPKELFKMIRLILTGKSYGPSMNQLIMLFNRDEIIKRINTNCGKT